MKLTPVKDCTRGHCAFYFPQFEHLDVPAERRLLAEIIKNAENANSHFRKNYPTWERQLVVFKKALAFFSSDVVKGCELLNEMSHDKSYGSLYYNKDLYLAGNGCTVCFCVACCG